MCFTVAVIIVTLNVVTGATYIILCNDTTTVTIQLCHVYCILYGRSKGFNSALTAIMCQSGGYRMVERYVVIKVMEM